MHTPLRDTEGAGAAPSRDAELAFPNASISRFCNECQEMKPLTAFNHRMQEDGVAHRLCRVCFVTKNAFGMGDFSADPRSMRCTSGTPPEYSISGLISLHAAGPGIDAMSR